MPDKDPAKLTEKTPAVVAPVRNGASQEQRAATEQSAAGASDANKKDVRLVIRKQLCLPKDLHENLLEPIVGPDNAFEPGDDFLRRLAQVASAQINPTKPSPALARFATMTTLGCSSELRPLDQEVEKVLGRHPELGALENLVKDGMGCRFQKEVTKTERLKELL